MEHPLHFRNPILKAAFFLSLAVAWFLCNGTIRAADFTEADVKAARKLYIVKCAKCHKLHDPAGYTDAEWKTWMLKMSKKAKLKHDQEELLSRYLETLRKPVTAQTDPSRPAETQPRSSK